MANSASSDDTIREHIVLVGQRDDADHTVLADALYGVAWPDGGLDRRHAEAQRWFDRFIRWRGSGPTPIPRTCGCAMGRCLVCN